ncbi:hypothetical protein BJ741DRAFT_573260 [Chytriomyces cf. hyalinus JEL632]|nr:hypothetical protein BJ741DRAFT_573260 [Chytriomyces cf. hyalinus JEL632]
MSEAPLKRTRSATRASTGNGNDTANISNGAKEETGKSKRVKTRALPSTDHTANPNNTKAAATAFEIPGSNIQAHLISVLGKECVTLGYGLTAHIAKQVVASMPCSAYLIATDSNLAHLHLDALVQAFTHALELVGSKARVLSYVIPPGESIKTRETKAAAEDWMLHQKLTRDSCIVALGGGVIGDLFGFIAATFMRGIPVFQVPTTLLAMVDSSIGGKTAVDTPAGKNLIGAFHQPRHIFMDLAYLRTLPRREYVNGMAEVIKTAAIWDEDDFSLLENGAKEILGLSADDTASETSDDDLKLLIKVVLGSIQVKAHVVTIDEKETGLRGLLNYGHSVGHAIEAILSPDLLHGECIAIGMVREAEIARHLGYVNDDAVIDRIVRVLQAYGLPVSTQDKCVLELAPGKHCSVDKLLDIMRVDKKNQGDKKRVVMLSGIGSTHEPKASFIADDVIRKILSSALEVEAAQKSSVPEEALIQASGSESSLDVDSKAAFNETSIVIIGMRGAGKSHMGIAAAKSLGRAFIDMDAYFDQKMGVPIAKFVASNSWEAFRKLEAEQLEEVLKEHPKGCVISCGGGIVETPVGRDALARWKSGDGHVLHLTRNIQAIIDYLGADKTRPALGEDPRSIWYRRKPFYKECSNAEFTILADGQEASWKLAERDFSKFVKSVLSTQGRHAVSADSSFFLSLTFADLHDYAKLLATVSEGSDALELRVDLLKEQTDEFIGAQIALIRRHSDLPIIFTVRTKSQGGRYPDGDLNGMFALLMLGLRHGCEFVDVEVLDSKTAEFNKLYKILLANKGRSHFIASYHDFSGTAIWDLTTSGSNLAAGSSAVLMRDKYIELHQFGDSVKLIGTAKSLDDNFGLYRFVNHTVPTMNLLPKKPLIAVNMAAAGQMSRVLNMYMTPVTHPELPIKAAPGQLSIKEIFQTRGLLGLVSPKHFYLFGYPIASSMSPTIHNTGFERLGLPHKYSISENPNWSHVKAMLDDGLKHGTFGGASVTIPHKEEIVRHKLVNKLTEAATKIGAVNTIIVSTEGQKEIIGDNTDWLGIRASILKRIGSVGGFDLVGGVIGAGGTSRAACFALQSLGVKDLRIWNRTLAKAEVIAQEFGASAISKFESLFETVGSPSDGDQRPKLFLLVSCIPGATQNDLPLDAMFSKANECAPIHSVGVFVEMAYRPRKTTIIEHLGSVERTQISWSYVEGVEILIEQGLEQFVRWTGRIAPRKAIEDAVYTNY